MTKRIKFTKENIEALPLPEAGKRVTYYDSLVPKLALRVTAADTRTFYIVKRDGAMAWVKLGTFPDMTVENARRAAQRTLGDFANGLNPAEKKREEKKKLTLGDAYEQYWDLHVVPHGIKRTEEMKFMWQRFLGTLPDLPAKPHGRKRTKHAAGVDWSRRKLDAIGADEVKALHAAIGREGQRIQANRVTELLSVIYNDARGRGYPGDNPAKGVRQFKETKRKRFIGEQDGGELARFFRALAEEDCDDFRDFTVFSLLTGARRGNVLSMRWQDVNLAAARWDIPDTKNGEPQLVVLVPEAVEILRSRTPQSEGYVFAAPSKTGYMTSPKKRWAGLLKRAQVKDLRIHDLRRSLGSWQAISGASLTIIGKSLGHKSADATMIYARLHLDPVRASVTTATSAMLEAAGVKVPASEKAPAKLLALKAA